AFDPARDQTPHRPCLSSSHLMARVQNRSNGCPPYRSDTARSRAQRSKGREARVIWIRSPATALTLTIPELGKTTPVVRTHPAADESPDSQDIVGLLLRSWPR